MRIGLASVVMLVVLRLTLGFHFLYEGVWKLTHPEFTAEPFLTEAKGPAAGLFYAMVPDIDGRERLVVKDAQGQYLVDDEGQPVVKSDLTVRRWEQLLHRVEAKYSLTGEQKQAARAELGEAKATLANYLASNGDNIRAYFIKLDDHEHKRDGGNNGAAHMKKRLWDKQQELRDEVKVWTDGIREIEDRYHERLAGILSSGKSTQSEFAGDLPVGWNMMDFMNFAVSYGLTAIGLCLMLGFCTRLAAIGGGVFMFSVILTQPGWPTIYPPMPPVVGHSLLVDKNFVEMVALFTLATFAAGRWGGLDFFLYHYIGRPLEARFLKRGEAQTAETHTVA